MTARWIASGPAYEAAPAWRTAVVVANAEREVVRAATAWVHAGDLLTGKGSPVEKVARLRAAAAEGTSCRQESEARMIAPGPIFQTEAIEKLRAKVEKPKGGGAT